MPSGTREYEILRLVTIYDQDAVAGPSHRLTRG